MKEDEENWISGEELCTEGSSDDDCCPKSPAASPLPLKKSHTKKTKKLTPTQIRKCQRKPSPLVHNQVPSSLGHKQSTVPKIPDRPGVYGSMHNEGESIPWRPKRGSIKLQDLSDLVPVELASGDADL